MKVPETLKYSTDHEWIKVLEDDIALVGITDHAQSELGEIVYVEIDNLGENVEQGDVFGTIEAVKTTSDLMMPVSGEVLEMNQMISEDGDDDPGKVNSEPYGDGWLIKIKMSNASQLEALMDAEAYKSLVA